MGDFTEVSIYASFKTNKATKKAEKLVNNFEEYLIKKRGLNETMENKGFDMSITSVKATNNTLNISLDSGRTPNATWQAEQVFTAIKENFKGELEEFSAEQIVPENIIWWNAEEDEE